MQQGCFLVGTDGGGNILQFVIAEQFDGGYVAGVVRCQEISRQCPA